MKIEKGVPLPEKIWQPAKYNFRAMEPGDSMFFPNEPKGCQSKPAVAVRSFAHDSGRRFTVRKEAGGVRIWRVE